jgi:GntR family transcriptional regulator/MocR family aminotransferase
VIEPLAVVLASKLEEDFVPARPSDLIMASSARQLMVLSLDVVSIRTVGAPVVAVEEPGYPTVMDTFEHKGAQLVGVEVDEFGAIPESLQEVLKRGVSAVLLTPRGHNPTGASWNPQRVRSLGDVLAEFPDVIVIEDDQFAGVASTRAGSLLSDKRLENQTIYIRSFSKSIAPDLRMAVAAARPVLRDLLADAKSFADGWTSRMLQRVLLCVLTDEEIEPLLNRAMEQYASRRKSAADAVNQVLGPLGGGTWCGPDGVNIWIHLPHGVDSREVVERSAAAGVRLADGEAFFMRPGNSGMIRLNAGSVPSDQAAHAGRTLGQSALKSTWRRTEPIHV